MFRIIRQLFKKKPVILGPYKGYIGSQEFNGNAGVYHGEILNIPNFWNGRIQDLPYLLTYTAYNKQMLQRRFEDKVDYLVEVIDSFWENQKTGK